MNIDSNTTIAVLCENLALLSLDVTDGGQKLLQEAADRLELLDIENTDLRMALSREKQDANFWQQKATEAMKWIYKLEEAGDAMMAEPCEYTFEQWTKAKETKP